MPSRPSAWLGGLAAVAVLAPGAARAGDDVAAAGLDTWGNFHAGGVVLEVAGDDDGDARAGLEVGDGAGGWRAAHPLVRVGPRFVGSLLSLEPGRAYPVRVTLDDPDGVAGSPVDGLLETRPDQVPEPDGRTWHVAAGAAGGDGSEAAPFGTLQQAVDAAGAGDLVLVRAGRYLESVTVRRGGEPGRPLTIRGEDGAVLDGAEPRLLEGGLPWADRGDGTWAAEVGVRTGHVVIDGERLYRFGSPAEVAALRAGVEHGYHSDDTTLVVRIPGGDPTGRRVEAARFEHGLYLGDVGDVVVEGLELTNFGQGDYGKGIYLRYARRVVVRRCRFSQSHHGLWIKGGSEHLVEHNVLHEPGIERWPWRAVKGSRAEGTAIRVTDDVGRGIVIRHNHVTGFFDGIGACGGGMTEVTSEHDLYGNVLTGIRDDAFEQDGTCSNVRMWGNVMEDVHMAFSLAPCTPGPSWVVRNVAWRYGNNRTHLEDGFAASPIKLNNGYDEVTGPVLVYHNTFATDVPETNGLWLASPGHWDRLVLRNNIVAGTLYAVYYVNLGSPDGSDNAIDLDGDALHTTDPVRFFRWGEDRVESLARLRADYGQEPSGFVAPPGFAAAEAGDLRLAPDSELIDRGLVLPGINDDYEGEAPDPGAVEYQAAVAQPDAGAGEDATREPEPDGGDVRDVREEPDAGEARQDAAEGPAAPGGRARGGSDSCGCVPAGRGGRAGLGRLAGGWLRR